MRAIVFDVPGDESVLKIAEVPAPPLTPRGVRIRVRATALNRADLLQRRGFYPPPPGASALLGLECSGTVLEVGEDVREARFAPGHPVMALLAGGGYAEEVVVDAGSVMPVPAALDLVEAGGLPEVFLTVFSNVFQLGNLEPGGTLLVHGGGSGVGTAAIRMAREAGARCIVTAGDAERCRRCLELGAEVAIDYRQQDFAAEVMAATAGRGVEVVLDAIGGAYLESNLRSLAVGGRLVVIGLTGGARAEIDLAQLMLRRLTVIGSTLRARPAEEKARIVRGFMDRFGEALAAGRLRPVVEAVLPLAQAAEAHRRMTAGGHFGKLILEV